MGVYAFAGGKGGVGKTTSALNVGVALAKNGYDVAVVDADLGMTDVGRLLDVDVGDGIHSVLAGERPMEDVLVTGPEGVTILPGATDLDAVRKAEPEKLPAVFDRLATSVEFVLVDTSAGLNHAVLVSLGAADGVLLLTTPKATAMGDAGRTAELAAHVDGTVLGTVVTRATADADLGEIEDATGTPVVGVVAEDDRVREEGVVVTGGKADEPTATTGYEQVAELIEACERADDPVETAAELPTPDLPPEREDPQKAVATPGGPDDETDETAETTDGETVEAGETDAEDDDDDDDDDEPTGLFGSAGMLGP